MAIYQVIYYFVIPLQLEIKHTKLIKIRRMAMPFNFIRVFLLTGMYLILIPSIVIPQVTQNSIRTVVIDPGHGGVAPGCVGNYYYEKNIVLGVSLRFGRLIQENFPDVNVIYTRTRDASVELIERSNIANKAKADLFISIHANSEEQKKAFGCETYVLGLHRSEDNMQVAQRENSVIVYEDDYESKYEGFDPYAPESYIMFQLMQNAYLEQSIKFAEFIQEELMQGPITHNRGVKQAGFIVLYKTASPSVLIELGFVSHHKEELLLGDPDNQDIIAQHLFNAFAKYKGSIENKDSIDENRHENEY